MSLTSLDNNIYNLTLDGLVTIDANQVNIDGNSINPASYVTYSGATTDVNLGSHGLNANSLSITGVDVQSMINAKLNITDAAATYATITSTSSLVSTSTLTSALSSYDTSTTANSKFLSITGASNIYATITSTSSLVSSSTLTSTLSSYDTSATSNSKFLSITGASNIYATITSTSSLVSSSTLNSALTLYDSSTTVNSKLSNYLPLTGGTVSGPLNNMNVISSTATNQGLNASSFTTAGYVTVMSLSGGEYTLTFGASYSQGNMKFSSFTTSSDTQVYQFVFNIKASVATTMSISQNNVALPLSTNYNITSSYSTITGYFSASSTSGYPIVFSFTSGVNNSTVTFNAFSLSAVSVNIAGYAPYSGASSNLNLGTYKFQSTGVAIANQDIPNLQKVNTMINTATSAYVSKTGDTMTGTLDMSGNKITSTYVPINGPDMCNKTYVDNKVATAGGASLSANNTWTGTNLFKNNSGVTIQKTTTATDATIPFTIQDSSATARKLWIIPNLAVGNYNTNTVAGDVGIFYNYNDVNAQALILGGWNASHALRIEPTKTVNYGQLVVDGTSSFFNDVTISGNETITGNLLVGTVLSGFSQWGSIYTAKPDANYIVCNDGTRTVFMGCESYSGYGMVGTNTNHDFVLRTNNTERVRISAAGKSTASYSGAEFSDGIAEFYHTNKTQGVGIGYAGVYACGSNPSQNLSICAKNYGDVYFRNTGAGIMGYFYGGDSNLYLNGHSLADHYTKQVYRQNISWGGGLWLGYAFYRIYSNTPVNIWGYITGYNGGPSTLSLGISIYCYNTGTYRAWIGPSYYTNVSYNHVAYPFSCQFNDSGTTGWYAIYITNNGNWITDTNDYVCVNVTASGPTIYN